MEQSTSAQEEASAAQRLDRNLLFQIFDYLRDGRAFLQCEVTCMDYHSLLREEAGIGQKLWQARPIAYGARVFATGGTAYTEEEREAVNEEHLAGTIGWAERRDREICDGGREVVLSFACLDAIGAAQRLGGAIITTLAGEQWTPLINRLHEWRHWDDARNFPPDTFPSDVVLAATKSVEAWIIVVMEKAWLCALHRGSHTVIEADIGLAGTILNDLTIRGTVCSMCDYDISDAISLADPARESWEESDLRRAIYFPTNLTRRTSGEPLAALLAELDVATQERIIRKLARRAGVGAYDGSAYERLWRLILLRLCVLLKRVEEVFVHHAWGESDGPIDWNARPSLETLAYVLQNGSGPIDPPPSCEYVPFDEDDGSFRSGDCPDTDDDDDSSIGDEPSLGDESAPTAVPTTSVADRLASLASLRASGALTEAEFARQALELGLSSSL